MESSDEEHGSDVELIDDILGPEDLLNDEADEDGGGSRDDEDEAKEIPEKSEETSGEKAEKKVKKPRVVKNPRVTLNFDSLRGSNGLTALKNLFKDFKFKGNNHEEEDLTRIMEILQQWTGYKLCPSYNFESCLRQLEALGKKKVVQTLMKKYRLGMDDWGENKSDGENNAVGDDIQISEPVNENEFDTLLDEVIHGSRNDDELSQHEVVQKQTENVQAGEEFTLTPEQIERIARNRKLAEERRMQRMSGQGELTVMSQPQQDRTCSQELSLDQINVDEKS